MTWLDFPIIPNQALRDRFLADCLSLRDSLRPPRFSKRFYWPVLWCFASVGLGILSNMAWLNSALDGLIAVANFLMGFTVEGREYKIEQGLAR